MPQATPPTGDLLLEIRSDMLDIIEQLATVSKKAQLAYRDNDMDLTVGAIGQLDRAAQALLEAKALIVTVESKAATWRKWAADYVLNS